MTEMTKIKQSAGDALTEVFAPVAVEDVLVGSTIDSEGNDAISITVVIGEGAIAEIGGKRLAKAISEVRKAMAKAGEERRFILEYATADELNDNGDSES